MTTQGDPVWSVDPDASLNEMMKGVDQMAQAVGVFRKKLIEQGVGKDAADRMAETFFDMLCSVSTGKAGRP